MLFKMDRGMKSLLNNRTVFYSSSRTLDMLEKIFSHIREGPGHLLFCS